MLSDKFPSETSPGIELIRALANRSYKLACLLLINCFSSNALSAIAAILSIGNIL